MIQNIGGRLVTIDAFGVFLGLQVPELTEISSFSILVSHFLRIAYCQIDNRKTMALYKTVKNHLGQLETKFKKYFYFYDYISF